MALETSFTKIHSEWDCCLKYIKENVINLSIINLKYYKALSIYNIFNYNINYLLSIYIINFFFITDVKGNFVKYKYKDSFP